VVKATSVAEDWYRRRVEKCMLEYARGLKRGAHLNWVLGVIEGAIRHGYLKRAEVLAMISKIESDPTYLPFMSQAQKIERLKPLRERLTHPRTSSEVFP